ncbi:MAG: hypothetical protein SNG49_02330 [Rikenellaceae bacterium]
MTQKTQQCKQETAKTQRTISTSTEALITAKCALSDLYSDIIDAIELIYGEQQSDRYYNAVGDALTPIRDLVDKYIIESIDVNIGDLESREF